MILLLCVLSHGRPFFSYVIQLKETVMSEDLKQHVDTNSAEFNEGVEAGLNSAEDTKNWQAGNALGQALKAEGAKEAPMDESLFKEYSTPLFMRDNPAGSQGNAQDEKDETEE
jgi:hypothetical protein